MPPKPPRPLKTHDIAKAVGVHVNTIRLYEAEGWIAPVPRGENGYRQYSTIHLEQARLIRLTLQWPYLGSRAMLVNLVATAAQGDLGMAIELAYQYLSHVRVERTIAESALDFLERWAAGHLMEAPRQQMLISQAAAHLNVTVDMLRSWERNGLIEVPRDPANQYRLYGTAEFGRLRVIRTLVQAGYSLQAILRMLLQFDAGITHNLRMALDTPREDEEIHFITDSWLSTLLQLEQRAQAIIRQIGHMIELAHTR
jgi:DNA-binding transcriptional MerR regulator